MARLVTLGGAAALLVVVVALPLVWLVIGSLTSPTGPTLEFYRATFTAPDNYRVLLNTLLIGGAVAVLSTLIGVPMAWLVSRSDMPGKRAVWTLVNVAYATPPFLSAIAYVMLLGPNAGLINKALRAALGLSEPPFNIFTVGGMVFVITLHVFPFVFLMVAAALESLDPSLEQSAQILGSRRFRT
ncbi:MAG: ABC transporter permease, partial [Candidatus Rokuibacteriota bacterium]